MDNQDLPFVVQLILYSIFTFVVILAALGIYDRIMTVPYLIE